MGGYPSAWLQATLEFGIAGCFGIWDCRLLQNSGLQATPEKSWGSEKVVDVFFLNSFELTGRGDELGVMWQYFPRPLFLKLFWGEGSVGKIFSECLENRRNLSGK